MIQLYLSILVLIVPSLRADIYDALIERYSPVLYLHREEEYFPISAPDYFTGPHTALAEKGVSAFVIPRGEVKMEDLYALYLSLEAKKGLFYLDISEELKSGSAPFFNRDLDGNLVTPCYVLAWENGEAIYLQYLYLYAFNGPYGFYGYDIFNFQGGHEGDIEHVTLVLDKNSHELKRLFYSCHGSEEGTWFDQDHPILRYEEDHPVVFIAKSSHANYPRPGTYYRIYGLANDKTTKGARWAPAICRLFLHEDPSFDPSTMGWIYHPGTLGERGVNSPIFQRWFGNIEGDTGEEFEKKWVYLSGTLKK